MISTQTGPAGPYTNIKGMDSRADWLFGPGRQDYLPYGDDSLIPFIMNLQDEAGFNFVRDNFLKVGAASPIFISLLYANKLQGRRLGP